MYCIERKAEFWHTGFSIRRVSISVLSRRLEDRIRKLLDKAISTSDLSELRVSIKELKLALHEHCERLRKVAARKSPPLNKRRIDEGFSD